MKPEDALVEMEDLLTGMLETLKQYKATSSQNVQESSKHASMVNDGLKNLGEQVNSFYSSSKQLENAIKKLNEDNSKLSTYIYKYMCIPLLCSFFGGFGAFFAAWIIIFKKL